jgi:hypothetical protein
MAAVYSFLTHEQLIDLTWKDLLTPLLLKRFRKTTAADLQEAHAHARMARVRFRIWVTIRLATSSSAT